MNSCELCAFDPGGGAIVFRENAPRRSTRRSSQGKTRLTLVRSGAGGAAPPAVEGSYIAVVPQLEKHLRNVWYRWVGLKSV